MNFETYGIFVVTTFVICLAPGPAALLILAQGISNGMRRSYWAIAGIALGNAMYFALSATGIAALIVASSTLFSWIKWLGVAYLLYLGMSSIFGRANAFSVQADAKLAIQGPRALWYALIVELSNPKALLYFVALLPQFIDPARPIALQMFVFGCTCIVLDLLAYTVYAWLGSRSRRFTANPKFVKATNCASGGLLLTAGMLMSGVKRVIH